MHQDLGGLGHFLDRHPLQIAEWILLSAQAAHSTAIFQSEMIRPHATMTSPAGQAGDDPVLLHKQSLPLIVVDRRMKSA